MAKSHDDDSGPFNACGQSSGGANASRERGMKKPSISLLLVLSAFCISPASSFGAATRPRGQAPAQDSSATSVQSKPSSTGDTSVQNAGTPTIQGPTQPIPFSHKQHAGTLKMSCQY